MPPEKKQSFVAIILGNESDAKVMQDAVNVLTRLQIPYEVQSLFGLDPCPDLLEYLKDAASRGLGMVVVGSYYTYTNELLPTISESCIPMATVLTGPTPTSWNQITPNTTAMFLGVDAATNAGLFAAKVLARTDSELLERLRRFVL